MRPLGRPGYGGVKAVGLGLLVERGGCAQENGHFDRLSADCLLFQSAVELTRNGRRLTKLPADRLTGWFLQVLVRTAAAGERPLDRQT